MWSSWFGIYGALLHGEIYTASGLYVRYGPPPKEAEKGLSLKAYFDLIGAMQK